MGQLAERQHTRALAARKRFPKAYRKVRGRRWKELRRAMRDVEKSTTTPSEQ
jgi:hypothetical protein